VPFSPGWPRCRSRAPRWRVSLLGGGPVRHRQDGAGLHLDLPRKPEGGFVPVVRLDGRGLV
jgi:alpha-L-fucosidase